MQQIKIKGHRGLYYLGGSEIDRFLNERGELDLDSETFKKANKTPIKNPTLRIRVSMTHQGKQRYRKRDVRFTDGTKLLPAIKAMSGEPEKLRAELKADLEAGLSTEEKRREQQEAQRRGWTIAQIWPEYQRAKTGGESSLRQWSGKFARTLDGFMRKWVLDSEVGSTSVSSLRREQVERLIAAIERETSLRNALQVIEVLHPMVEWWSDLHGIDRRNPVPKKTGKYVVKNRRIVEMDTESVRRLFEEIDRYEVQPFRDLLRWIRTGRRRGEIVKLKLSLIDREQGTFTVTPESNKAGEFMEYPLLPELADTLPPPGTERTYLFEGRTPGEPIHADSVNKHWRKIRDRLQGVEFKLNHERVPIRELHIHDLRHIITGIMKRAGVPEEVRAKTLGHVRGSITERYGADYWGDIEAAQRLALAIIRGEVPENTRWKDWS